MPLTSPLASAGPNKPIPDLTTITILTLGHFTFSKSPLHLSTSPDPPTNQPHHHTRLTLTSTMDFRGKRKHITEPIAPKPTKKQRNACRDFFFKVVETETRESSDTPSRPSTPKSRTVGNLNGYRYATTANVVFAETIQKYPVNGTLSNGVKHLSLRHYISEAEIKQQAEAGMGIVVTSRTLRVLKVDRTPGDGIVPGGRRGSEALFGDLLDRSNVRIYFDPSKASSQAPALLIPVKTSATTRNSIRTKPGATSSTAQQEKAKLRARRTTIREELVTLEETVEEVFGPRRMAEAGLPGIGLSLRPLL
ncbi:hypothetical protein BJ508DRAFT_329787 [Ascobolus immersus RN42]|uniref:Uncharacterized protein n=1 Tax=Ascobolus immersus RN42 TaxID=1160509 RepID=A0A3N4HVM7_ASCIM|nr:hypothetical protein BJ508DRAFT_329787 [Ascobolus immersus RN42]